MSDHRISHGDCREILKELPPESADLIIADPPYRIKSWRGFGSKHNKSYDTEPLEYDEWLGGCYDVLKPGGTILIFESPFNIFEVNRAMRVHLFNTRPPIIWFVNFRKSHPSKGNYNNHYEPILWGHRGEEWYFDSKPLKGGGSHYGGDVFEAPAVMRALVPGQKPDKLIERLIAVHCPEGGLVLDPFGGAGTTTLAAKRLNRKSHIIEIDAGRARLIEERLAATE
jgi:DNA modification methylase